MSAAHRPSLIDRTMSLAVLASAAVAAAPASAFAEIVSHQGRDLHFPIHLPGGNIIRSVHSVTGSGFYHTNVNSLGGFHFSGEVREVRARLTGVSFGYAQKGQTVGQVWGIIRLTYHEQGVEYPYGQKAP